MNVATFNVKPEVAAQALAAYKAHRSAYDTRDWEIERIYRAIARGKHVISVRDAIVNAGIDDKKQPKLAIARADWPRVRCVYSHDSLRFEAARGQSRSFIDINFPGTVWQTSIGSLVPRIPPQFRPAGSVLHSYHILFEADWTPAPPADPYLLRRLGADAWLVCAAWELTEVELSVIRAHR